jgi:hypothetical protein
MPFYMALGDYLLHADQQPLSPRDWEQWFVVTRRALRKQYLTEQADDVQADGRGSYRLVHTYCQRRYSAQANGTSQLHRERVALRGLLEPDAR